LDSLKPENSGSQKAITNQESGGRFDPIDSLD